MRKLIITFALAALSIAAYAQNIHIGDEIPASAAAILKPRLEQMLKDNAGTTIFGIEIYIGSYGWSFLRNGELHRCEIDMLEKNDVKLGYSVKMHKGLQKSMSETMEEAEKALEDPEVQKQIEKAFKDAAK